MIRCPKCGKLNTPVTGYYHHKDHDNSEITRHRKCADCGYGFNTHERVKVKKKKPTGQRATFQ